MKTVLLLILSSLFILNSVNSQVNNEWQWSHPKPQGNDIRFIKMISPTNWVSLGYTGTFMRSTNAGASWVVYSNLFGFYSSFLGQGKNIYGADFFGNNGIGAGTQGYIARTTNGGSSWDSIGSAAGTTALWNASFGDANTVYIGGNSGMVLKSTNAGLTFVNATVPSSNANRTIFAVDASTVYTGAANGMVYKSVNGGTSWTGYSMGSATPIYGIYFFNANTGVVAGGTNVVRYTTNGGTTWTTPGTSFSGSELRIYGRKSPDEVYVLGNNSIIWKSTDYGVTWSTISFQYPGQPVSLVSNTMDISGSTMLLGGVNGLLNISTNSGTSWTGLSKVLNSYDYYDIAYDSPTGRVWATGRTVPGGNSSIIYSTDRGSSWTIQPTVSGTDIRSVSKINSTTLWGVGQFGKVIKTTDAGTTWTDVTNVPTGSQTMVCTDFINVNTGWVCGVGINSIFRTTDAGASWVTQNTGSTDNGVRWLDMADANTGYYISYNITNSRIFRTTNGGTNWDEMANPNPGNLWKLSMVNANTGFISGDQGRLFRTTNGTNWTQITAPGTNNYTSVDWYDVNNGVLGAGSGFAAITTNGGQSWGIKNTGGSSVWTMNMVHPDTIFSSQAFGYIFKFMRGSTGITTEWNNEVPNDFVLKQNYPNPFNPTTTIEFAIPSNGDVSLKVYDISGRFIKYIINGMNFNPGTVKIDFDGSDLSSGVYFYTLEVNGEAINTKKMILIK